MALAQEDIEQIKKLIQQQICHEPVSQANVRYELDLRERTIRVEEELKHQRELILQGFKQSDKRFEDLQRNMEHRFEQVDKRFEQVDKHFEQVDKRFEQVDKRFEQVNKQFEQQHKEIMSIHQEIKTQMRWGFGIITGVAGLVVAILKLMPV